MGNIGVCGAPTWMFVLLSAFCGIKQLDKAFCNVTDRSLVLKALELSVFNGYHF